MLKRNSKIFLGFFLALLLSLGLIFGWFYTSLGELREFGFGRLTNFPGAQSYLIVLQNDAERRPTGGFITAYGILHFQFGFPSLEFGNVYDPRLIQEDTLALDATVAKLLAGPYFPGHGFRDSNFDPDFPISAEEMLRLFKLGFPEKKFAGVIALNFTAVTELAAALGLPEINFSNLSTKAQSIDRHNTQEIAERKNFIPELARQLLRQAFFAPRKAVAVILENLQTKNILLYFRDPGLQKIALAKNFAGSLAVPPNADFLAIVEGNYGGYKSSRYLLKDFNYTLNFVENLTEQSSAGFTQTKNPFTIVANLKIALQHAGQEAEPTSGFYKSFWRVYLPREIILLKGDYERQFTTSKNQILERIVQLRPGEATEFEFTYQLPETVWQADTYQLKVWRQSGGDPLLGRITAHLPLGYETVSSEFQAKEELAVFEGVLQTDQEFNLQVLADEAPPRLAWQKFKNGLKQIELRFNEPLQAEGIQLGNFQLRDLNFRDQETAEVAITQVNLLAPQTLHLEVTGVPPVCREHFGLKLAGIADQHGNVWPEREITVVSWLTPTGEICDPEFALSGLAEF